MPKIRLEKLCKQYGSARIIHGIDLEMDENEFTVLVGPSGCGKSTVLRMIAGLETVSSGEIYIDERPVGRLEPKDRDIAMVFQDYALYPHMNVARNMSFALRLERRPKAEIEQRVQEVARMLGLEALLLRKPAELSGGQRQRVAMGRALTRDASTFLFDEPLSNLDAKLRGQMRAELALMRQKVRKNMIYVTHDQVEAMTLGQRIVVLQDGHIRQQGSARELFTRPNSKFVAGFIGSPPMNFMRGELTEQSAQISVTGQGFSIRLQGELAERARQQKHKAVYLGIRPSDIERDAQADSCVSVLLEVLVSEYIGAQTVLVTACADQQVLVEHKSDDVSVLGETHRFIFQPDKVHLFDAETERAI